MTALILALLLSQQPEPEVELATVLFAAEPPPATLVKAVWRWQGEDHEVWVMSERQARLTAARMESCEESLKEAQVEAVKPMVPAGAWVAAGAAFAALAIWLGPPVISEVKEVFR